MFKRDGTAASLSEFKNYFAINNGLNEVAKTFGIPKFATTITVHRNHKEPQFPDGKVFAYNTQYEWIIYRGFLKNRNQHELLNVCFFWGVFGFLFLFFDKDLCPQNVIFQ
jgi:hypothetical protein